MGIFFKFIQNILCTKRRDIPHLQAAFHVDFDRAALDRHRKWSHSFRRPQISSAQTLPFLHTPFPFQSFELAKYSGKFHCFTGHFDSLRFIHTKSCTFSYNYVSVF